MGRVPYGKAWPERKKLTEVAERWATARPPKEKGEKSLAEQCQTLGLPDGAFSEYIAQEIEDDSPVDVDPDNWDSVLVFLGLSTSWRKLIPPFGGLIWEGLIKSDVWHEIRDAHGFDGEKARDVYHDVRVMELAALSKLNEK